MRRVSTRFKARVRIVDAWVDVGARSGESVEVARPHCPVRLSIRETHLGHCHSAGEALRLLPGRLDTRATHGPARRVRGGARAACHPPASLGVASALRAIPLAPAAVDRARAPRERPDLVQICPSRPPRETVFFLCRVRSRPQSSRVATRTTLNPRAEPFADLPAPAPLHRSVHRQRDLPVSAVPAGARGAAEDLRRRPRPVLGPASPV